MKLGLAIRRRPRRPSLTPMIDVVFLLLVFFMLAVPLRLAGGDGGYAVPPRVMDVLPDGQRLNGVALDMPDLLATLATLTESPADAVILRARDAAALQRVLDVMQALEASGHISLVLLE